MRIRVLICDGVPMVRDGLVRTLESEPDIEVVGSTGDGWNAVSLARRLKPDVVITDLELTGISGLEMVAHVVRSSVDPVQVLVFTSFSDDASIMRALEVGAYGYLVKQADSSDLVYAVRALATGEAAVSGQVVRRLIDWLFWRKAQPMAAAREILEMLTPREREVLRLVATGMSNGEIAKELFLEESTVRSHTYHLRRKLDVRDRAQLVSFAYQSGFSVPTIPRTRDSRG